MLQDGLNRNNLTHVQLIHQYSTSNGNNHTLVINSTILMSSQDIALFLYPMISRKVTTTWKYICNLFIKVEDVTFENQIEIMI